MFQYNTITESGLQLLAQASAANPIVYIGAVAATHDYSAYDLSTMGDPSNPAWDVTGGEIVACSATNTTARIITGFRNRSTSVIIKTIGVLGKLASQSDSDAVVVAATSDPYASLRIPDETEPPVIVMTATNLAITDQSSVTVTSSTAGSAMLSDLDRFVSCHKAGNPNQGEDQIIEGYKQFADSVFIGGALNVPGNSTLGYIYSRDIEPRETEQYNLGYYVENGQNNKVWSTLYVEKIGAGTYLHAIEYDNVGIKYTGSNALTHYNHSILSHSEIDKGSIFLAYLTNNTGTNLSLYPGEAISDSSIGLAVANAGKITTSGSPTYTEGPTLDPSSGDYVVLHQVFCHSGDKVICLLMKVTNAYTGPDY